MKKLVLIILLFLIGLQAADSQWIVQYPYTAGVGLRDIKFINNNTGWICGDGVILKTTNMGTNWIQQVHPAPDKYLFSIHPVDSNIVYCVGYFETILKTTNGGTNWFAIKNGPVGQGNSYRGTCFINSLTGWVIGFRNQIYKTTNGGVSFDSTYALAVMNDIHFKDSNTGLIVGDGAAIFKTINQGLIWDRINMPPNNYGDFRKLSVINNQYCFVVEDGRRVYKSTNYGDTWDSIGYVTGAD
ncbi:MAG: YCF48-related protein, partial [Ignavibacteria bacterium]|nr:YCF48-related protein [Ignavibacteria bacterium]